MTGAAGLSEKKRLLLQKHLSGAARDSRASEIPRRRPGELAPISAEQTNVWLHAAMAPDVTLYNEAITFHRRGSFDRAAFEKSFAGILRRHEIWRTSFRMVDGQLRQIVHDDLKVPLPLVDLTNRPESEREKAAADIAAEDARKPFDLSQAPLLRAKLVRLAPGNHRLYLTLHHIIFDGVSIYRIILPELIALYAAYEAGREPDLAPPRLQYGDYALWRAREIAGRPMARELDYWRRQLAGELSPVRLPADRPRPAHPTYRGSMETFQLSSELTERLKRLSRDEGVTLYVVLLGAFKALLHRYSGQDDIVIGGATDMRRRPELAGTVGYFLNSLPLRTRPSAATAFRDYLRQVQDTVIGALDASNLPFDRIVREIQPKRDGGAHPIFQILFSIEPPPPSIPEGWDLTQMDVTVGAAKFDLYLELDERPEGIIGRFLYSSELFDAPTIRRMIGHWTRVLEAVAANPRCTLGALPLLTAEESRALLVETNATARSYSAATVPALFEAQARERPDAAAVECGGRRLSYRELHAQVEHLAARLRKAGVARGSLVAVMLDRSFEMVAAVLAVQRAGGAYLPIDPQMPQARIAMLLQDAAPAVLLTQTSLRDRAPPIGAKLVFCDEGADSAADEAVLPPHPNPDDLAYVLYTSGSTGKPKAVEIRHRSLANVLNAFRDELRFGSGDSLLAVTTLSFDIAGLELFLPLISGGRLVLATRDESAEPVRLRALLQDRDITVMQATPATWRALIAAGWSGSPRLKVLCGGEALQHELAGELLKRCQALWNVYGPTETTIWSLFHKVRQGDDPVPIGRPLANTAVYVLDANGEPVPAGVAGELYIGGAGVARGYRNDPDLTAQRFCTRPHASSERLYRTGDIVRFRGDGLIEFLGRSDNQVKVRGFRVALEEVEAAIAAHPDVAAAAVRAFPDRSGEQRLVGFIVPKHAAADGLALSRSLQETLPAYMVPSRWIALPSLPKTANGKIDRARLAIPCEDRQRDISEPRDNTERMLADFWKKLLGIDAIGRDDNFFDLGGHSLLAAMLAAEIKSATGRDLPLATLFRAPTIALLAEWLRKDEELEFSHLVPLRTEGSGPPLFLIHGIFGNILQFYPLAQRLQTDRPVYAVQARGVDPRQQPHTTLAEMVEAYIDAIRSVQPHGPYALGGYSFGGLVAYEIACRLREAGEQIELLALLETDVYHRNMLWRERLSYQWTLAGRVVRKLKILSLKEWPPYLMTKVSMVWHRLFQRIEDREPDNPLQGMPESMLERNREMHRICIREFIAYRPRPFSGAIAIFHTAEPPFDVCDPLPLWKRMAGRVEVFTVAGTHGTIMDKENVDSLAHQLGRCLTGLQAASAGRSKPEPQALTRAALVSAPGDLGAAAR